MTLLKWYSVNQILYGVAAPSKRNGFGKECTVFNVFQNETRKGQIII